MANQVNTESQSLRYLGLSASYEPSPSTSPIDFLSQNLHSLPPHIALAEFSKTTTPRQRTSISTVRNRRLKYTRSSPPELAYDAARTSWPMLWQGGPGSDKPGAQQRAAGDDERRWVEQEFIGGWKPHVQKLGQLLAGYEEEREGERERAIRRQKAQDEMVPEEDSDSDDEDEEDELNGARVNDLEDMEVTEAVFLRLVHERFIYGMLDSIDYDAVDWDESLDEDEDRDAEERWFNEEEED